MAPRGESHFFHPRPAASLRISIHLSFGIVVVHVCWRYLSSVYTEDGKHPLVPSWSLEAVCHSLRFHNGSLSLLCTGIGPVHALRSNSIIQSHFGGIPVFDGVWVHTISLLYSWSIAIALNVWMFQSRVFIHLANRFWQSMSWRGRPQRSWNCSSYCSKPFLVLDITLIISVFVSPPVSLKHFLIPSFAPVPEQQNLTLWNLWVRYSWGLLLLLVS